MEITVRAEVSVATTERSTLHAGRFPAPRK
jgi:hypothetical protein